MKSDNELSSDEFLGQGLEHILPTLRAMQSFIDQTAARVRQGLESSASKLRELGLFDVRNAQSYFDPQVPKTRPEQSFSLGLMNTTNIGFYVRVDYSQPPSQQLYVGFWIYHPERAARSELHAALQAAESNGYLAELEGGTAYLGTYVPLKGHFPDFVPLVADIAQRVTAALAAVDFKRRFGSAFLLRKNVSAAE